jgi:hypothetical protein
VLANDNVRHGRGLSVILTATFSKATMLAARGLFARNLARGQIRAGLLYARNGVLAWRELADAHALRHKQWQSYQDYDGLAKHESAHIAQIIS